MKKAVCRFLINWYQASDAPLPAWLQRASDKDATLAEERDLGDSLTRSLRQSPNESEDFGADSMAARVMRQITEENYLAEQEERSQFAWGGWMRGASLAACACVIAVLAVQFGVFRSSDKIDSDTIQVSPTGELASSAMSVEGSVGDALLPLASDWKNPLDQEIEYVISDAKGALGFLADNFVPKSMLKKASDTQA